MGFVISSAVARKSRRAASSLFLTPICSDVDSTANTSNKPAPVSKAETITDMETGEVVGRPQHKLDSNISHTTNIS
jgi:hypothetical protein